MRSTLLAPLVLLLPACDRGPAPEVVGVYGPAGFLVDLRLERDGSYEALFLTGLTADGCGTFEGAGLSTGRWARRGGRLAFEPELEKPGLVRSMAGATAVVTALGLELELEGEERFLPRREGR